MLLGSGEMAVTKPDVSLVLTELSVEHGGEGRYT